MDSDLAKAVVETANDIGKTPGYTALVLSEFLRKVANERGHFGGLHLRGMAEEIEEIFAG